jgi:hypothetical protein
MKNKGPAAGFLLSGVCLLCSGLIVHLATEGRARIAVMIQWCVGGGMLLAALSLFLGERRRRSKEREETDDA